MWSEQRRSLTTKLYWGSKKDDQWCACMATHPITNSKRWIISDAMAPVGCQRHLVSRSSGSNSQSGKCLLNAGKSRTTPWLQQQKRDLGESHFTWIKRVPPCLHSWWASEARCWQSVYTADIDQGAGCQEAGCQHTFFTWEERTTPPLESFIRGPWSVGWIEFTPRKTV